MGRVVLVGFVDYLRILVTFESFPALLPPFRLQTFLIKHYEGLFAEGRRGVPQHLLQAWGADGGVEQKVSGVWLIVEGLT